MDSYISLAGILETPMEQSWRGTGWRGWVFKKTLIYTVPVAVVLHKSHTLPVNNPKYVVCRMMYCRWLFCCIWLGCQFFFFFWSSVENILFIERLMCALLHHEDTCEPLDAAHHTLRHTLSRSVTVFIMFCYESMEHDGKMLTCWSRLREAQAEALEDQ